MNEQEIDPYERHARRFLNRLQVSMREFSHGDSPPDEHARRLQKLWPQVLTAFWWASQERSVSNVAEQITDALLTCSDGDIAALQSGRASAEVRHLAELLAATARQQENANDAAFLYRVAGITLTQATILQLTEQTGAHVRMVMEAVSRVDWAQEVARHRGGTVDESKSDS